MMDESDDDFKELCASFFQRVKKNGTKEVSGERKTQKASNSTQITSKPKRTKPAASKSKTLQGPRERKTRSGSQAPRTKKQGAPKWQESESAPSENGERSVLASAVLWESAQSTQTEAAPNSDSQPPPFCLTALVPSPSKPRAAELVLQRMQQFKRADPERLKHASEVCSLQAALEENVPKGPQEAMMAGNGSGPWLPATESDTAVALALQQEFGHEQASAHEDSLEEKGLFFCQICQKNLSAMNVIRREQHVNRCLDEAEKALRPSVPQIPECPICGKPFLTPKSRISHLKQCAVKMEVGPQLLLQAVRLQTAQPEGTCSTLAPVSSFRNPVGGLKRKGAPSKKEPQKRRKVNEPEVPSEDLLVAMALSRSEMKQETVPAVLRLGTAFSERAKLATEKKSRKKKVPISPPQLLVQDLETTGRQIEDRVAQLFAEEVELSSTPPLPESRLLREDLEKASRCQQLPEKQQNFLWEGSALTGAWAPESFYTASLVPPLVPQRSEKESMLPPVLPDQPELGVHMPPVLHSASPRNPSPSASQREHQALQDLIDLAGEGLSASPRPCSRGLAGSGGTEGMDLLPDGLPLTGFVLPPKEQHLERGGQLSLSLLVADFGAMVNNPHLSDVQFQMDSGEVLYVHKFVLYARCPLLMQYVNSEGFFAVEDGDLRTQRVLLSDVSAEAMRAFLHYLYTADTGLPPQLAPDLSFLARRFGVSELVHLCEQASVVMDSEGERWKEKEDKDCESRAENFQELLRSMWVDEEEEVEALLQPEGHEEDREKVNEAEMEEIYEFAATQRKLLQEERAPEIEEETDRLGEDGPSPRQIVASVQVKEQLESEEQMESFGQGRDEAPAKWKTVRQSMLLTLGGQCADREEAIEAQKEALGHSSSSSPSQGCQAERREGVFLYSVDVDDDEQPFPSTPGGYPEPSQITSDLKEGNSSVGEKALESSCPSTHQQTPPSRRCFFSSQTPPGRSPSQPHRHLHRTTDSSPPKPQPQGRASRVDSQDSPLKQRRGRSLLTLLDDAGCQKGKECGSMLECRNKGVLISPEKSLSIDLTQAKPSHRSSRSQNSLSSVNREDEIILLLDSDEELELEQNKIKSVFNSPPEEGKVLKVSPKSSEPFSVIDVDADQEPSQSPPRREATLQQEGGGPSGNQGSVDGRGTPQLFRDPENSPDEDSTTDTSWLVPATPLASRSRDCSSQTQIMGLRSRTSVDQTAQLKPRAPLENKDGSEAASKFSVIMPQTSSSCLVPVAPGSPDSRRQIYRSPSSPQPRRHKHFSPLAPCPTSGGLTDFSRQFQKCSPPRPSLLNQATASEVVEVEDSEDEQEMASRQASSSPLLDSNPPIPSDDSLWHIEPLSPIPIDHLNLERTGPLSTSSPGGKVGEVWRNSDCHSPGLLATTPIRGSCAGRGSCTGRRKSQEKSPRASSPGSSRLSFLNSALWDDWDEEQKSPEGLPLAQTPSADRAQKSEGLKKPKGANRRKNLPPKVPITPMPQYSIMETPVLKKELDRFGVRPLPKRQMVLKLKEIFQYTHQTLESDSEDESQSSQVPLEAPCSQTHTTKTSKASRAAGCTSLQATSDLVPQRSKESAKSKGPRHRKQPGGSISPRSTLPAEEVPLSPDGDTQLPASQKSMTTSVDSGDSSFSSQSSSSCEFGVAFESAGEDEGEDGVGASQAAVQAVTTEEAVRRYIRSTPALYRKVLLYQPFELAELQAELKQQGIRMTTRKLLDFLDAHCITFTTAAARKEKLERKRRQPVGRKKRGKTDQPVVPRSPPTAVSGL